MKLNQFKGMGWADSEGLSDKAVEAEERRIQEQKEADEELKRQLEAGEISESQYKTLVSAQQEYEEMRTEMIYADEPEVQTSFYDESKYLSEDELPDPADDLTKEDKIYLATK